MSDYYYSQRDKRWAGKKLGRSGLNMSGFGCVVTGCAMILSYFYDRLVLPSELLKWLNENEGFTYDGRLYWHKIEQFTKNKLRFSYEPNPKDGEITYGIRNVEMGRYNHWVIDHPRNIGKVVDPLPGEERAYREYSYLNKNRFFLGVLPEVKDRAVDTRYGKKRTWNTWLLEQKYMYHWIPGTPANYIYRKIGRTPTDRELNGLVYGHWEYGAVFENTRGDVWLDFTKEGYIGAPAR